MNSLILSPQQPTAVAQTKISKLRRLEILQASRQVLAEGYTDYSMRKVAAFAGVRLNTVQYHFGNLQSLTEATCLWTLNEYLDKYREMGSSVDATPLENFGTFLDLGFKGLHDKLVRRFFVELWAMALHNPPLGELLRVCYLDYRKSIAQIVMAINPSLSISDANLLATLIVSWGEGLVVLTEWGGNQETAAVNRLCNKMKLICIDFVQGD